MIMHDLKIMHLMYRMRGVAFELHTCQSITTRA
jgi:hypothetical protein